MREAAKQLPGEHPKDGFPPFLEPFSPLQGWARCQLSPHPEIRGCAPSPPHKTPGKRPVWKAMAAVKHSHAASRNSREGGVRPIHLLGGFIPQNSHQENPQDKDNHYAMTVIIRQRAGLELCPISGIITQSFCSEAATGSVEVFVQPFPRISLDGVFLLGGLSRESGNASTFPSPTPHPPSHGQNLPCLGEEQHREQRKKPLPWE